MLDTQTRRMTGLVMGMEYRMNVQARRLIDRKVSSYLQAKCASCSNDEDGSVAGTSKDQTVL
jgi:hypothetical protein